MIDNSKRKILPVAEPLIDKNELAYVHECIESGWVSSTGKFIDLFEELCASFTGTKYGISTANGTVALHLALMAFDIKKGDEVIVPSLTFIATANAVTYTGATPVFVDSEADTWNIDPAQIEAAITSKTKAIIPVHLYGHPANMDPILEIAKKHKLVVIEDAAEAQGAKYKGRSVGSLGDIGIFSFYGNKIITTGEGGMVVTDNINVAEKIRLLRDHGMAKTKRYWHTILGYNYRMTNIQAAIGVAQMEKIESIIASKISVARHYANGLKNCAYISLPPDENWAQNVYWLYTIILKKELKYTCNELIDHLYSFGVETRPLFPPIHTQPIYNKGLHFPVAEHLSKMGISLPSSANLKPENIKMVTDLLNNL